MSEWTSLVIHAPCDSHFHHEETLQHWETCSKMFTALFFIKVHNEKQSKCPSTVEQKYYSIYKYYNTIQVGIKIAGKNINNLRYADDTTLMEDSKEELKSFLRKVKKESEKVSLKLEHSENQDHGIQSHHFMANTWGNNRNSDRLYFLGLQDHCRWWL